MTTHDGLSDPGPGGVDKLICEQIDIAAGPDAALARWRDLCARTAHSFFVSPGWVRAWCETLPESIRPRILIVHAAGRPACAGIFTLAAMRRLGAFPTRAVHFHATGTYAIDTIESVGNHFLCFGGDPPPIRDVLAALPFPWEEAVFPGFDPLRYPGGQLLDPPGRWRVIDYAKPTLEVDLEATGRTLDGYLGLLSCNTRAQIRRSLRHYETHAAVRVTQAATVDEAMDMFTRLNVLFALRRSRSDELYGEGSFFHRFHRRLIRSRFPAGEIQLLHVRAGDETIGYLYNHVYRGVVHFYQCGFVYQDDSRARPGLVSHAAAVAHNARLGHAVYDFGPGDARYKRSLSTESHTTLWCRLLRPSLKMLTFKCLKEAKERVQCLTA